MKGNCTRRVVAGLISFCSINLLSAQQTHIVSSPDKNVSATIWLDGNGAPKYSVSYHGKMVLKESKLGVITNIDRFVDSLTLYKTSNIVTTNDNYVLFTGKRSSIHTTSNNISFHFSNKQGKSIGIEFRASNDGICFRYYFVTVYDTITIVNRELTTFDFDTSTTAFLQPMQVAKSGWNQVNPCYEEHYQQDVPVTTPANLKEGWVYPALFHFKDTWLLISETSMDGDYCGTRLSSANQDGEFAIEFPGPKESFTGRGYLPVNSRWSPWRIIAVGSLKTIVESTLGTDVAAPAKIHTTSFVKPGKSSWSWIMSKDDSIVYSEQKRYIDFASKMNWQYCLIDADWDRKIGYEKIKELSTYAAGKNVGLILWYNSAGDWNTVKYTPKNKLLTHEGRTKEFSLLQQMGIKGVKIDFFGGDGQSMIQYYIDILEDAAKYQLLVNFHGATLPRGWQRTYPNLLTTEAIKGFEYITFTQADADVEANHCCMLPFTRNVFDPMDFTPMNLYKIGGKVKRKTTSGFELATSVIFLSGIQHFAESPDGMSHVPGYVQDYLRQLPVRWDDVKFLDGYPGKYVVIARKSGKKWYVAGINGENIERQLELDLTQFKTKKASMITDGAEPLSFSKETINTSQLKITMKPSGGFVIVLE